MAVEISTETVIDRPVDVVAAYVADPGNAPEWYSNIEAAEWETTPPLAVGSRVKLTPRFLGMKMPPYTYTVLEHTPGERFVMRTEDGPFPVETTYTWSAVGGGSTRMTLTNRGEPSGLASLTAPMVTSGMRKALPKDLAQLKSILER